MATHGLDRSTAAGGSGAAAPVMPDPNADRIVFWDDSASQLAFLTHGTGIDITGSNLTLASNLQNVAGLAVTDGNIIVGNGSSFVAESGATARTSLGLGTGDAPTFSNLTVTTFLTGSNITLTGVLSAPDGTAAAPSVKVGGEQNGLYSPDTNALGVALNGAETFRLTPLAEGGASWARKNAIIGGDFSTNPWQRGTSFAAIATAAYSADRWIYGEVGDAVHTLSKSADAPTVAQAGRLTNHCLLIDCTTIDAAVAAADLVVIGQKIEGYNFLPLAQKAMTLSFWHKHTKTGTYCVSFRNSGDDRSYVAEYTQDTTDTWEYATITVSASPSAGTWDYTNGVGLYVNFALMVGSTYQTTANTWQTGNFLATANQVNGADSASNNFRIALVQLEAGSVATEFESRTVQEELALCQRYYAKTFPQGTAPAQAAGSAGSIVSDYAYQNAAGCIGLWKLPVVMRTDPTLTVYNPTQAAATWRNTADAANANSTPQTGLSNDATVYVQADTDTVAGFNYMIHAQAVAEL